MYNGRYQCRTLFLQAGIVNGDYEAAGFSGQLAVVTLDAYNESEAQPADTTLTAVVAAIVIIVILVVVIALAVILIL